MSHDKVVELKKQAQIEKDSLTDLLLTGARQLLFEAVQVELGDLLFEFAALKTEIGRQEAVSQCSCPIYRADYIGPMN